jgi:hypothetical protein
MEAQAQLKLKLKLKFKLKLLRSSRLINYIVNGTMTGGPHLRDLISLLDSHIISDRCHGVASQARGDDIVSLRRVGQGTSLGVR